MNAFVRTAGTILLLGLSLAAAAQTRLEIHQINVGNGDGALIKLYDNDSLVYTIVIDGGLRSSENEFLPYIKAHIPDMPGHPGKKEVNWVILSHNHRDHFNGLIQMFNDKAFIIREIADQGGYTIGNDNYTLPLPKAENDNCNPFITSSSPNKPQKALVSYVQAVKTANTRALAFDGKAIKADTAFVCATKKFNMYTLSKIGGVPVTMDCFATNAFTDGDTDRNIGGLNPNNFTFGWVLEYGKFRFYTGGDLGGYDNGTYTDQETPMAAYLKKKFPNNHPETGSDTARNFPGHVCVMKTNHHGSTQSSNPIFLKTLACSSIVTSAGKHDRWKIPTVEFVNRVAAIPPFDTVRGVYFTQVYNYPKDKTLARANLQFKNNPAYNYVEPGNTEAGQYSYVFIVKRNTKYTEPSKPQRTVDITKESIYEVDKVRTSDYTTTSQHVFLCHKP